MQHALWILFWTALVEFVIAPIGGRVFDYYVPKDAGIRDMIPDIPFYHWGYATIFALGCVAGIAFYRWRKRWTKIKSNIPTSVRLQFQAGSQNVRQLSNQNVRHTHSDRMQLNYVREDGFQLPGDILWYVVIIFKEPTQYGQVVVDAGNAVIPEYRILGHSFFSATVVFMGDVGNVALEIKTVPPNPLNSSGEP